MDNLHQAPWAYTSTTATGPAWVPTTQTRSMKRTLSESDCDDLYSEESSKDQTSPGDTTTNCHLLSRKKRRGVIEKRRRDRINSSLSELKTLVPSAYEKQGSAKLEKAEILQLTVEHLKSLSSKGIDAVSYDHQRFAMNYHIIGFRECAAEVARYLVTIEGMDIQDPLRLRLMTHLQYFVQQRELSVKTNTPWPSSTYQSNCTLSSYQPYPLVQSHNANYVPNLTLPNSSYTTNEQISVNTPVPQLTTISHPDNNIPTTNKPPGSLNTNLNQHIQQPQQLHQPSPNHQEQHLHYIADRDLQQEQTAPTYIELSRSNPRNQSNYVNNTQYPNNGQEYTSADNANFTSSNCTKPYRPWGAEMVY